MGKDKSQSEKFKDTARDLECDDDESRWEKRLSKVAKPEKNGGKDDD